MKDKINLKDIEPIINREVIEVDEINGKKIIFDPNISCHAMLSFCEQMSDEIFDAKRLYLPKLKDVMVFAFLVENATNINVKKDKEGNYNIDFLFNLLVSEIGQKLLKKFKSEYAYFFLLQELKTVVAHKREAHLRSLSPHKNTFENIDGLIFDVKKNMENISKFYEDVRDGNLKPEEFFQPISVGEKQDAVLQKE